MNRKKLSVNETVEDLFFLSNLPYEKFDKYGVEALNDADLFAVILRTGSKDSNVLDTAYNLMNLSKIKKYGLPGLLRLTKEELLTISGIGKIKAAQLMCIAELCRRIRIYSREKNKLFSCAKDVSDYYMESMRNLLRERVLAVFLDSKSRLICDEIISIGTVNLSVLCPRELFSSALKNSAVSVILLHNHPSGDPYPSKEDKEITARLKEASKILEIPITDHIIIGDNRYYSFRESGLL